MNKKLIISKKMLSLILLFLVIVILLLIINITILGNSKGIFSQEEKNSLNYLNRPSVATYGYEYKIENNTVFLVPNGQGYFASWDCSGCDSCEKKSFFGSGTCEDHPECPSTNPCKLLVEKSSFSPEIIKAIDDFKQGVGFQVDCESFNIDIPKDSIVEIKENKLIYTYSSLENNNKETTTIEITCTCTEGSGCHPFYFQGKTGCAISENCNKCSKKTEVK